MCVVYACHVSELDYPRVCIIPEISVKEDSLVSLKLAKEQSVLLPLYTSFACNGLYGYVPPPRPCPFGLQFLDCTIEEILVPIPVDVFVLFPVTSCLKNGLISLRLSNNSQASFLINRTQISRFFYMPSLFK